MLGFSGALPFSRSCRRSKRRMPKARVVTILRGAAHGTGDLQARALIPFLEIHLPQKNPRSLFRSCPGAAGRRPANHIYTMAKPDGLTIDAVGAGLVVGPILGLPDAMYDLENLVYLGSTESGWPYILGPGAPTEVVTKVRHHGESFQRPEFPKFKKTLAADPTPLTGEELETAIEGTPRIPRSSSL